MAKVKIPLPAPREIEQWQHNFLKLNQARIDAARGLLSVRQQQVFDLLPILFHLNHPRLPGFGKHRAPEGVMNFTPTQQQLDSLQTMARGLQLHRHTSATPILGLYLIGSIGSVAQSGGSDLDVWLCYDESLVAEDIKALQKKCDLIEEWAGDQGTELHFFLMNLTRFRSGQRRSAQGEDSGSTQHLLLLDEFYRSVVWLAGGQPRWWLVPNEQEIQSEAYWQQLVENHRVDNKHWLNFGSLPGIPAAEFVGAGLWQLNKGLEDPYKSVLKLLLTRHYASQYPHSRPLCWDLKSQVHEGNIDRKENDGYLLLLKRVTHQLEYEGNQERVELIRKAFYYKVKLPLSEGRAGTWRNQEMLELCHSWGWTEHDLEILDERPHWDPIRIQQERNALISEMLNSYQFLLSFSQKYVPKLHATQQDLLSLGNRLYASFDARPGKVTYINPGISPSLAQDIVCFNLKKGVWQLITGVFSTENPKILKQSPSLVELMSFAILNNIIQSHTRIIRHPQNNPLSNFELRHALDTVKSFPKITPNKQAYLQAAQPKLWYLFVNVGVDPQGKLSKRGMQKISNRDDALGYSSLRENLVHTIDLVTINSWGEWHVERFTGDACLLESLQILAQQTKDIKPAQWPEIQVHCNCASRAQAIRQRVEEAVDDVLQHFVKTPRSPYIMEVAESYYIFESKKEGISLQTAETPQKLLSLLQRRFEVFTAYTLDRTALLSSPVRLILQSSQRGQWQLFFWLYEGNFYIYFLDEKGALLHQQWPLEPNQKLIEHYLLPLIRFIKQIDHRLQRQTGRSNERKLILYEVKRKTLSYDFDLIKRKMPAIALQSLSIDLRAAINNDQQVTLYCNNQEFNGWEHGQNLYEVVAQAVRSLRASQQRYPIALNDLELPEAHGIIDYLQVRQKIERLLNR